MNDTDRQALLKEKASKFMKLMNHYAQLDRDVNIILDDVKYFVEKINKEDISVPHKFPWSSFFFRGDNNVGSYYDLINSAADFANFIEDVKW